MHSSEFAKTVEEKQKALRRLSTQKLLHCPPKRVSIHVSTLEGGETHYWNLKYLLLHTDKK